MRARRIVSLFATVLAGALLAVASPSTAYAVSSQHGEPESLSSSDLLALGGPFYIINANGKYLAASGNLLVVSSTGGTSRYFNTVRDGSWVTFEHDATGRNVNTSGNGTANGTRAVLSAGSGSFTQDWGVLPVDDTGPLFRLQNRAVTTRCLGISGGSSGTNVAIFNCDRAANQRWRLQSIT
jgi:hypothetical protein